MNYLIATVILFALCGAWGLFQLWIGHQADGTPIDSEERDCHGCGARHASIDSEQGPGIYPG